MAAYPAVIELRVDGVTQVTRVLDTINKLDNALVSIKKTPLAIDAKNAVDGIRVLKKEVDDFVIKLGNGQRQLASTTAGLNSQAQAFKQLAANTKIAGESFKLYTQAAEQARQKTSLKGGLAEIEALNRLYKVGRTAPTQSFMGVDELLALGEKLPKNIASLELYRSELQRVFSLVDIGTKEFEELAAAIAKVDKQVSPPTAGGGRARGPSSPIGGRADIPGSPAALKAAQEARGKLFENLALGAGFPLLFGGGPGQVLGGLAGSFVGTGFGGQILGSAIGGQLEQLGIAANQAGQALQKPIDNFAIIEQRALLASSSQERYVKNLIDAGQYIEAAAAIQKRYDEVIGAQGSAALVELAQSSDNLNRAWNELNLQIQAALAGPLADLLNWVAGLLQAGADANKEARTQEEIFAGLSPDQQKEFKRREAEILKGANIFNEAEKRQQVAQMARGFTGTQGPAAQPMGFRAAEVQDTASLERRREIQAQITQLRQAELAAAQSQLQQDVTILTKQQEFATSLNQQSAIIDSIAAKKIESANIEYQQIQRTQQSEIINKQLALESAKAKATAAIEEMKQLDSAKKLTETKKAELQAVVDKVFVAEKDLATTKAAAHVTTQRAQAERDGANALTELERRQQNVAAYAADAARNTEAFTRAANEGLSAMSSNLNVIQAFTQAQQTINNLEIQSLQAKLNQAATDNERYDILYRIRDLEIENAKITLYATRAQIKAEIERQRIALAIAEVKFRELQAVVNLARAQKVLNQGHLDALAAQKSALVIAQQNYETSIRVANEQWRAADAVYEAAVQAAEFKASMEGTAAAAERTAAATTEAAAASKADKAAISGSFTTVGKAITPVGMGLVKSEEARRAALSFSPAKFGGFDTSQEDRQAAMTSFRERIMGSTGSEAVNPQVNITTGPVMQMDGTNYVTQRDLVSATGAAARQGAKMALETLRNSPSSRRSTGVTR